MKKDEVGSIMILVEIQNLNRVVFTVFNSKNSVEETTRTSDPYERLTIELASKKLIE